MKKSYQQLGLNLGPPLQTILLSLRPILAVKCTSLRAVYLHKKNYQSQRRLKTKRERVNTMPTMTSV